jgi:hypothetical protein
MSKNKKEPNKNIIIKKNLDYKNSENFFKQMDIIKEVEI